MSPLLDFEDLPAGTTVTTHYSNRGVLFGGAFLATDPAARSGTRVLRAGNPVEEFHPGPFVFSFTNGQRRVRFFAGAIGIGPGTNGTLRAFDSNNILIVQDGPKLVTPNAFTTLFEVSVPGPPRIVRVELEIGIIAFESIDNLEFEPGLEATLPTTPPVVQITSPTDSAQLDVSVLRVQGTVTGEGLLQTVTLTDEVGRPPGSLEPPSINTLPLIGSGTTRTFTLEVQGGRLGPHIVTAEAENIGGLKGSDAVRFTNLPTPIRNRHAAEGGTATFGQLRYGSRDGTCAMAVYERGVISAADGTTRVVRGAIFNKWFSLRDSFDLPGRLGCPTEEERNAPDGARAQTFARGRIYAGLPTGAHYVPSVFVQAIAQLGGEENTGVPIADPSKSPGLMKTWLFQQFRRPNLPDLLPSTLEIRGTPPRLLVQRQGGDLSKGFFSGIGVSTDPATIWEEFPCDSTEGPCTITPPSSEPPLQQAFERICGTDSFGFPLRYPWPNPISGEFNTQEWMPVLGDDVLTPIVGIVEGSWPSDDDNPLTHQHERSVTIGELTFFPADWNVTVRPLHPFRNLLKEGDEVVKLEFEEHWARVLFTVQGWGRWPLPGDLLFASGRWIIDCGHVDVPAEIHPPAVLAFMQTITYDGGPATQAIIWVNGFYSGEPVEFDIFPPPRPSPNALLSVQRESEAPGSIDVSVEFDFRPTLVPNHARMIITASPRPVIVDRAAIHGAGEMMWQTGRSYIGRWLLYWE